MSVVKMIVLVLARSTFVMAAVASSCRLHAVYTVLETQAMGLWVY